MTPESEKYIKSDMYTANALHILPFTVVPNHFDQDELVISDLLRC